MNARVDLQTMSPVNLQHYWMPFTDNRRFKAKPRLIASAKDMYFTTVEGKQVLDGLATLWCVNAGHGRPRIVEAIRTQAGELDFASSFALGHPLPFRLAERIAAIAPQGMQQVFFTNSGSEAVDTALKIAVAYHRLRGQGTRTRFVGRERSYHGVNIGGMSVGGVAANRKAYSGMLMPGVDHIRHTHDLSRNSFSRGQPDLGAELADELEQRIIPLHDASNIAALIVDPVAASGGVLVPPKGYLERLRDICTRHGILLIFDEVITGWGRLGATFAAQHLGIKPDLITFAKGITSGAVPLGGVLVRDSIYQTFMGSQGAGMEFFHGYTYSGHPLACAAALGALDTYEEENLFQAPQAKYFEEGVHSLKGLPNVVDCRNLGLIGAVELASRPNGAGERGYEVFEKCWDRGVFVRPVGDSIAFCPPLIAQKKHLDQMFGAVAEVLKTVG
ncbi:MAG TPA: aspartate aminotransferase family protein [Burkholderiales bacterium]|nr:aspartate aminotransferase family protein [Burkholderiales bacterium]